MLKKYLELREEKLNEKLIVLGMNEFNHEKDSFSDFLSQKLD